MFFNFFLACGGSINNYHGDLLAPTTPPFNHSTFYCQWSLKAPMNLIPEGNSEPQVTLTVVVRGLIGRYNRQIRSCIYLMKYIMVTGKNLKLISIISRLYNKKNCFHLLGPDELTGIVCGNVSQEAYVIRSPSPYNYIKVMEVIT